MCTAEAALATGMSQGALTMGTISLASTLGSAYMNQQAQEQQSAAMRRASENYQGRLDKVQDQATDVIQNTAGKFGADEQAQQMAEEKAKMQEMNAENLVPVASAADATQKSSPRVVGDAYNKVAQGAYQQGIAQGDRNASLNQWANNRFLNGITLANSGQKIGQLSNFSQGWGPVYQAEMSAAQGAGGGMKTLGSVLGGIGTISGIGAGAMNGGLFGGGGLTPANTASNFVNGSGQVVGISPSAQWAGGNFYVPAY